jgi:malonate decarboxylase alpha subunit
MKVGLQQQKTRSWTTRRDEKKRRLQLVSSLMNGPLLPREKLVESLEALIAPGDRIVLEGDNQKQADFLSRSLVKVDPKKLHDLHLIISSISRPEQLTLFELGIAKKIDFAYAGPQSLRVSQLLEDGVLEIGAIHTYVELYARLYVDLAPNVVLVCAEQADRDGNLYTGPGTEDTPVIVEAAAFHDAIVIVQVNEIVEELPRVDIPSSWVDVVVEADRPFAIEPLFTRDPRQITDLQILMGMMVIRGIYERHQVHSLNHGIGFDTGAIELLLPTYGESLGLRGKICEHWALNPHPTLIPAIESGWVKSVHCFGSEVRMDDYTRARPDVFFTGHDGSLRSNRVVTTGHRKLARSHTAMGATGSVGFELATGRPVTTETSDLDIAIWAPQRIVVAQARFLWDRVTGLQTKVDVRVENSECGFSLEEYVRTSSGRILLRYPDGLRFGDDPWNEPSNC